MKVLDKHMQTFLDSMFSFYVDNCLHSKKRYERDQIMLEQLHNERYFNYRWFREVKDNFLEHFIERYQKNSDNLDYLYSFKYRGVDVDVFIDDYGQQEYCQFEIEGDRTEMGGGAYNDLAIYDFCMTVDYKLEDAFYMNKIDVDRLEVH